MVLMSKPVRPKPPAATGLRKLPRPSAPADALSTNPLDLRRLRHLRTVVAEGSLSAAAVKLGLSQPALSASIKSLETDLALPLLERHRHGVQSTDCADALLEHVQALDAELDAAWSHVTRLRRQQGLALRIGCGPSEATRLLPLALVQLRRTHPELRVFVEYGLNEVLMPMVRRGEVDCALSSIPRSTAHADLQHEPLHSDQAVIVARVGHPLTLQRSASVKDLARYPWVLARRWELERKALDDLFAQAGQPAIEAQVETTSAILMKALVAHSDFLTFVPREMIQFEERAQVLQALKLVASSWDRQVGLTTHRDREVQAPVAWLREALRAVKRPGGQRTLQRSADAGLSPMA
jgi:DNA-binding transcriptional LysR family regulator